MRRRTHLATRVLAGVAERSITDHYATGTLTACLKWIFENRATVVRPIEPREDSDVDFDEIYKEAVDAAGIPKLFDDLVTALGDIIALNVIDSTTVKDALESLRVILKANRSSQAAVMGAMNWANFVRLTLKGYAKKIGGPAFEAFDKCYEEAAKRVDQANVNYSGAILERLLDESAIKRFIESDVVDTTELINSLPAGFVELRTTRETEEEHDGSNADVANLTKTAFAHDFRPGLPPPP